MPDDTSLPAKKHRVIGWKPESAAQSAPAPRGLPRWVTTLLAAGGTFMLLFTLYAGYRLWRWERLQQQQQQMGPVVATSSSDSLREAFVGRSRAEFAREAAMKAFEAVRNTPPTDHPVVLQRLLELQRLLAPADKFFGDGRYQLAVQQFEAVEAASKSFADDLADRRKAREGYDKFLVEHQRLGRFKETDPETFESALTSAGASRRFLDEGSFKLAREEIEKATKTLLSIEEALKAELEERLSDGRAALAEGNGVAAQAAFTRALELKPGNETAEGGLKRAKTIAQVFTLMGEAERLEKTGAFENAQKLFEQAFALDGQSAAAQAGVSRVKIAIRDRDHAAALARAETAFKEEKWADAIAGFEAAIKLVPGDKGVEERLAETRVRQRQSYITKSLEDAYAAERVYEWNEARRLYLALLQFEPEQDEAKEGLARTGTVIRALLRFERQIEEARSLAQRASFQTAIAAFNEAMANKPSYLNLTPDQEELKNLLEAQSRPVQLTFVSDGKTYVTIQGVRILGKFMRTTVPVLPGNYAVVGRRKGYEEVQEPLRVRTGEALAPITVVADKRSP
jgi:tetratricopeptide (TPR) repeat protein